MSKPDICRLCSDRTDDHCPCGGCAPADHGLWYEAWLSLVNAGLGKEAAALYGMRLYASGHAQDFAKSLMPQWSRV